MAMEQMAKIKFSTDIWPTVKLFSLKRGDTARKAKRPKCKAGDEICSFKSEIQVIRKNRSLQLSFNRVGNELASDKILEFFAESQTDPHLGRIEAVFVYLSERDYKDDKGNWHNWFNETDPGLKIKDVQITEADVSGGVCFATLAFGKKDYKPFNL